MDLAGQSSDLMLIALPILMFAGWVHGAFGVGFPMVATPLIALFTDIPTAVMITLIPTMAVNISMITRGGLSGINKIKAELMILPLTLSGTIVGTLLLRWLDPRVFLLILAAGILLYLNQERIKGVDLSWVRRHKRLAYVVFGLSAGLMAGTVNVMLPVLIILFTELRLAMSSMVVLFNLNFLIGKLTQTQVFIALDMPGLWTIVPMTLWLVPPVMLTLLLGLRLQHRIAGAAYIPLLRGLLWVISIMLLIRFAISFIG